MNIEKYDMLNAKEYDFLRTNPHLGDNIILLGLGGSHAYGTDIETSDWDWRGIATRTRADILTGRDFEQVSDSNTDTVIYSFDKIVKLLTNANPNTIEILGLAPSQMAYVSPAGQKLIDNAHLFLSKKARYSFGGYALAQLNRLVNKSGRLADEIAANESRSIQKALSGLVANGTIEKGSVLAYEEDGSPVISIHSTFPIEKFVKVYQAVDNVHTDYRSSSRNNKAIGHGKLAKHAMHLVRLYFMAIDILEKGEINTYREKEHDFLMDIRNGKYLDGNTPTPEFMDIVNDLENKLEVAAEHSPLPDAPDMNAINRLVEEINMDVFNRGTPSPWLVLE